MAKKGGILPLLEGLRRIIARWVITESPLTANAAIGASTITVRNTIRFQAGDEILIKNNLDDPDIENGLTVKRVIDETHIELNRPLSFAWTVAAGCSVMKTFHGNYVRAIYLGEPDTIPQYPAITVNGTSKNSEWYTTRATKERYNVEIGVFVEDATQEEGYKFLLEITAIIEQGLKRNIYPLVDSYETFQLTQDIAPGDVYIKVDDTSKFVCGNITLIEDEYKMHENHVKEVVDGTTLRMETPIHVPYLAANTQLIKPDRFIHNSWPSDTNEGKIHKGTLLKCAVISYFAEEIELQFNQPWSDTQLK